MHILKTNFHNNPNIGLYGFATDSYCILPTNIPKKLVEKVSSVLKVPVYQLKIFGTDLIGILVTGNKDILLVPDIIYEDELKQLKKTGLKFEIISTKFTALGNNIIIKDDLCLVNPELEDSTSNQLKKHFKLKKLEVANMPTIGSCMILNKEGCLVHRDASEKDVNEISKTLSLKTDIGTVNTGSPYVRTGLIANSNGYIMGNDTTGVEMQRIDSTLGFLK